MEDKSKLEKVIKYTSLVLTGLCGSSDYNVYCAIEGMVSRFYDNVRRHETRGKRDGENTLS